jgi:hypothetical protein
MGNVPFRSAPARIPETLDQFSTDLISLDRFGSKGDIAGGRRYVRYSPESRHRETLLECPLSAKSGHRAASFTSSAMEGKPDSTSVRRK